MSNIILKNHDVLITDCNFKPISEKLKCFTTVVSSKLAI